MSRRLKDKVAVITGGASGLGLAAVEMFVAEGAKVVVADIRDEKARALEERFPRNVRFKKCDVRAEEEIRESVELAVREFGGLDIMYHNAGTPGAKENIESCTATGWDDTQAIHLRASALCIKHAVRPMKERGGGSIILTSSVAATNIRAGQTAYAVAKGGVIYLGRSAALEFAPHRIRVNTIVPGIFATPIYGDWVNASPEVAELMPKYLDDLLAVWQPFPIAGKAIDIAYAATFFASEESRFITGTALPVDGGLTLGRPNNSNEFLFSQLNAAKAKAEAELEARSRDSVRVGG